MKVRGAHSSVPSAHEEPMKIVAILESSISIGGGFNQALNAIRQMQLLCADRYDLQVLTTRPENTGVLAELGIPSEQFAYSILDSLLAVMSLNTWWQSLQARVELIGPFEKKLINLGCNLVYFTSPTEKSASLQTLNFITTAWDDCHRDMPEFPEVRNYGRFQARERLFQNHLSSSLLTLTDSEALAELLAHRYGIDRERLLPMPFAPAATLASPRAADKEEILKKYALEPGYFFYPAQFWAHKNHIRILEALVLLNAQGNRLTVAFSGGNQGNRSHVESFIQRNDLANQVRFLDFVPTAYMPSLYLGCSAVIMPTYFGPTNLPPLEAWAFEKPLIYSRLFADQARDAAILIDPDDASELALAMMACTDDSICSGLITKGQKRLKDIQNDREESEKQLLARLDQFEKRLRCWN